MPLREGALGEDGRWWMEDEQEMINMVYVRGGAKLIAGRQLWGGFKERARARERE